MDDPGKPLRQHPVQVGRDQVGQKQKQSAEFGMEGARCQIELADIRYIGCDGAGLVGSFLITSPRQLGEPLLLEDCGDRRRAQRLAVAGEGVRNVVNREVLLPQRDDLLTQPLLFAGGPSLVRRREEEVATGMLAELMDENAKATWSVAEAGSCLSRGEPFNEVSPQGLVLTMSGIRGFEEPVRQC